MKAAFYGACGALSAGGAGFSGGFFDAAGAPYSSRSFFISPSRKTRSYYSGMRGRLTNKRTPPLASMTSSVPVTALFFAPPGALYLKIR